MVNQRREAIVCALLYHVHHFYAALNVNEPRGVMMSILTNHKTKWI